MAVYTHDCANYRKIIAELSTRRRPYSRMYSNLTGLLIRWGNTRFTQNELQVLLFIIGRTLLFGKCGEKISRAHFIDGVKDQNGAVVASGLSMRLASLKTILKSFAEKDFINCHTFEHEGVENVPRVYEINYTVLSELFNSFYCSKLEESVKELRSLDDLYRRKNEKSIKVIEKGGSAKVVSLVIRRTKPEKIGGTVEIGGEVSQVYPKSIEDKYMTLLRKVSRLSPRVPIEEIEMSKKIADNCKNPRDIVSAIKQKHSSAREGRAAAARTLTKKKWTMKELQALLDSAVKQANDRGHSIPRIVATAKGSSLFHRRLLDYGVSDAFDFILWSVVNWSAVASANFRAKQKSPGKSSDAMMQTPNFKDLVFRCPYILAFYNDAKTAETIREKAKVVELEKQKIAAESAAQMSNERKARARQLDLKREQERKDREQATQRQMRKGTTKKVDIGADDLPSLEEWERRRGLRK